MKKTLSLILIMMLIISCSMISGCSDKVEVNGLTFYKSELVLLESFTDEDIHGDTTEYSVYAYPENDYNNGGVYIEAGKDKYVFDWGVKNTDYPQIKAYDFDGDGMLEIGAIFTYAQNVGETFKYSEIHILEKSDENGFDEQIYVADEYVTTIEENIDFSSNEDFSLATKISYGEIVDFSFNDDGTISASTKYDNTFRNGDEASQKTGAITAVIQYSSRIFTAGDHKIVPDK